MRTIANLLLGAVVVAGCAAPHEFRREIVREDRPLYVNTVRERGYDVCLTRNVAIKQLQRLSATSKTEEAWVFYQEGGENRVREVGLDETDWCVYPHLGELLTNPEPKTLEEVHIHPFSGKHGSIQNLVEEGRGYLKNLGSGSFEKKYNFSDRETLDAFFNSRYGIQELVYFSPPSPQDIVNHAVHSKISREKFGKSFLPSTVVVANGVYRINHSLEGERGAEFDRINGEIRSFNDVATRQNPVSDNDGYIIELTPENYCKWMQEKGVDVTFERTQTFAEFLTDEALKEER